MKKLTSILILCALTSCKGQQKEAIQQPQETAVTDLVTATESSTPEPIIQHKYKRTKPSEIEKYFAEAYKKYPNIPKPVLESIAFANSSIVNMHAKTTKAQEHKEVTESCLEMPLTYGYFGVYGKNGINSSKKYLKDTTASVRNSDLFFSNVLAQICKNYGITETEYRTNSRTQILAFADYLSKKANVKKQPSIPEFEQILAKVYTGGSFQLSYIASGFETEEVKIEPNKEIEEYIKNKNAN